MRFDIPWRFKGVGEILGNFYRNHGVAAQCESSKVVSLLHLLGNLWRALLSRWATCATCLVSEVHTPNYRIAALSWNVTVVLAFEWKC